MLNQCVSETILLIGANAVVIEGTNQAVVSVIAAGAIVTQDVPEKTW